MRIESYTGTEQQLGVCQEVCILHLLFHIENKLFVRWRLLHDKTDISFIASYNIIGIDVRLCQGKIQVKKITPFFALV